MSLILLVIVMIFDLLSLRLGERPLEEGKVKVAEKTHKELLEIC
jgi:hypothetical protein